MKKLSIAIGFLFLFLAVSACIKLPDTIIRSNGRPVCPPGILCDTTTPISASVPSWPKAQPGKGNVVELWTLYGVSSVYVSFYPDYKYKSSFSTNTIRFENVLPGTYYVNFGTPGNLWLASQDTGAKLNFRAWYRINGGAWAEFTSADVEQVHGKPEWTNVRLNVP